MIKEPIQAENSKSVISEDVAFDVAFDVASKKTVLITGGAGYIGTILVSQLLSKGYKVRILDRFLFSKKPLRFCVSNPNVEIFPTDLQSVEDLKRYLNGVDTIVHLAGLVGDPSCALNQTFTRQSNILTTRNLYQAALDANIAKFIFASSCSVYGYLEDTAYEDGPTNPVSIYAETKLESEQDILSVASEQCCATILRFATVFGHSYRPRFDLVANRFVAQAIEDGVISVHGGAQFRPFVHTQDIARAIVKVLEAPVDKVQSQIFNVGDRDVTFSIQGLAEVTASLLSGRYPVQLNIEQNIIDQRSYVVSFDKIKDTLGFTSTFSVEAGVMEVAQQFEQGAYLPYTHESYSNVDTTRLFLASQRLSTAKLDFVA